MKNLTKESFKKDLSKLVSFRALTSDVAENNAALDFIEEKISKKALIKRIKNGNAQILMASNKPTRSPDICYMVHVDVVAGRQDQFQMKMKEGTAYGRGVSDMKFSIPIGYQLLNDAVEARSELAFMLVVTTDEETGGFEGASYLAKRYGLKPRLLLVPDGGDDLVFMNKSKGVCALRLESTGVPAHASRIWSGKNALEPIVDICGEVLRRYRKNNKKESWKTTVNIGIIQGGISTNQVCPAAFVTLDFRFPETTTFKKIFDEVTAIAKKIDPTVKISTCSIGSPTAVDVTTPVVRAFIKSFEETFKKKIEVKGAYGASDARHFADLKVPILMIKPVGGDIHGDNENVNIDSCLTFYAALKSFLAGLEEKQSKIHW